MKNVILNRDDENYLESQALKYQQELSAKDANGVAFLSEAEQTRRLNEKMVQLLEEQKDLAKRNTGAVYDTTYNFKTFVK